MAYVEYIGSFGGNAGAGGLSTTLLGSALPSDAKITSIKYAVTMSCDGYASNYFWVIDSLTVGNMGISNASVSMSSNRQTVTGAMGAYSGAESNFSIQTVNAYVKAHTTYPDTSYLWDIKITVNYVQATKCEAPTSVTVSNSKVDPSASVTLSWSGATAGKDNAIKGYQIYRSTSASGSYSLLTTVYSSNTYGSTTVTAPSSKGSSYYYKVLTVGSVSGFNSGMSSAYAVLSTASDTSAVGAPTAVSVSAASVSPGTNVTLSWSGAKAGTNNSISGYNIYRSTSASGSYSLLTSVASTATGGSATVAAPSSNGVTYYFKVSTVGSVSGYNSGMSVVYASVACTFEAVGAPTTVMLDTTNAAPGGAATLTWSGASAGDGNAIAGFEIYRATSAAGDYESIGSVETTETKGSYEVTAPTDSGAAYYYKVATLGAVAGYDSSLSSAYAVLACTVSAPVAPTRVLADGGTTAHVLAGGTVTLRWSGAASGANNPLVGYAIYKNGVLFADDIPLAETVYTAPAPDTAGELAVYAVAALGEHLDSGLSVSVTVYSYSNPEAPTIVQADMDTAPAGMRVRLFWSGAAPGADNAVTGYNVYRATTQNGAYQLIMGVTSPETTASCLVDAPMRVGGSYYYRIETVGTYSASGYSDAFVQITARESQEGEEGDVTVNVFPKAPREKRGMILGDYDTRLHWTLTGWTFPEPEHQSNLVEVPGRSRGPLDLSTVLTDGDPRFVSRPLTATFECSEGTREDRDAFISEMVNKLNGHYLEIILPDDAYKYAAGRVRVETNYSDLAHAAVTATAVCEPWRYFKRETRLEFLVSAASKKALLINRGRRILIPEVTVKGSGARVELASAGRTWTLSAGAHLLPDLILKPGNTEITFTGTGAIQFVYREAIL